MSHSPKTQVTFVGNAGFLIIIGDTKILIDALFEGFIGGYALPAAELDLLLNGKPPFDNINFVLATHKHGDHFTAELVGQCLAHNPSALFIAEEIAASQVVAAGHPAIALPSQPNAHTHLVVNGIKIEAMYFAHGDESFPNLVPNLGYIVTVGERKFFHTGDADLDIVTASTLRRLGVPERQIDIAFVGHYLLSGTRLPSFITKGIRPEYIVPMHYAYTDPPFNYEWIAEHFPEAILFRAEMDSWTMP